MIQETMNLHEALSELKILNDRISKAMEKALITHNKKSNKQISGINIPEYEELLKGNLNSIQDLIKRRTCIKNALIKANANIKIIVNNVEMTLSEAIDLKQNGIKIKENFLNTLRKQYNYIISYMSQYDKELEDKAERHIQEIYTNKEKVTAEEIVKAKENYKKPLELEMVNPNKIESLITTLDDEINLFKSKVDSVISTANAINTINIEY